MVHINISTETKLILNTIKGQLQQNTPEKSITYDDVVNHLCYMYQKKCGRRKK